GHRMGDDARSLRRAEPVAARADAGFPVGTGVDGIDWSARGALRASLCTRDRHWRDGTSEMSLEPFNRSAPFTLGVELELQIVNSHDYDLTPGAEDLLRVIAKRRTAADVKPEITSSMIETSTGVCENHGQVIAQLREVRDALVESAERLNLRLCGGGTHPFQDWSRRRIFDTQRFRKVSELYGYLSKQFTVFGQHVHIGCPSPDEA